MKDKDNTNFKVQLDQEIHQQVEGLQSNLTNPSNWKSNKEYKKMSFIKVGEDKNGNG